MTKKLPLSMNKKLTIYYTNLKLTNALLKSISDPSKSLMDNLLLPLPQDKKTDAPKTYNPPKPD